MSDNPLQFLDKYHLPILEDNELGIVQIPEDIVPISISEYDRRNIRHEVKRFAFNIDYIVEGLTVAVAGLIKYIPPKVFIENVLRHYPVVNKPPIIDISVYNDGVNTDIEACYRQDKRLVDSIHLSVTAEIIQLLTSFGIYHHLLSYGVSARSFVVDVPVRLEPTPL